jgi:hypothetical protein
MSENKKSLFDIVAEANSIEQKLLESGGEVSEEIEAYLTSVEKDLANKVDAYHAVMGRAEAGADYFKARADEFYAASKVLSNFQSRLKDRIKGAIQLMGKTEIAGEDIVFKLSRVKPSLVIESQDSLPQSYLMVVTETVPDKDAIRTAIEQGATIPGAVLKENVSLRTSVNKKVSK